MKKQQKVMVLFVVVMTVMLGWASALADFEPFASTRFISKSASINSSLSATFKAKTYDACSRLGLRSYSLYKSDGTWVTGAFIEDYKAADIYTKTIDLSAYGESGKSYYVVGILYADGETKSVTSGTISY